MEAEKKAFKITKREIGFVLGIVVFLLVKFLPLAELSSTVELTVGAQTPWTFPSPLRRCPSSGADGMLSALHPSL